MDRAEYLRKLIQERRIGSSHKVDMMAAWPIDHNANALAESVEVGMAIVDAICDKDESLSPRHTHSDVQGTVYGGVQGDY